MVQVTKIKSDINYKTSLLRGYSMIPSAPRDFSSGISVRTTDSSRTVSMATQFSSANLDTVGFLRAGNFSRSFSVN